MNSFLKNFFLISLILNTSVCFAQDRAETSNEVKTEKESLKKIKKQKKRSYKLKFRNLDSNKDNEISLKEYIDFKKHSLEKAFDRIDRDQDGVINRKEFARMQKQIRINKKRNRRN